MMGRLFGFTVVTWTKAAAAVADFCMVCWTLLETSNKDLNWQRRMDLCREQKNDNSQVKRVFVCV